MLQRKTSHVTVIVLIRKRVQQSLYRPGQAFRVSEVWGCQIARHSAHEGHKVLALCTGCLYPAGIIPGTHFY